MATFGARQTREHLDAVPAPHWLDLFNAQFVITDKVRDVWRDGVFFDQQHPAVVGVDSELSIGTVPVYEATELWLIADDAPTAVVVATTAGSSVLTPEPLDVPMNGEYPEGDETFAQAIADAVAAVAGTAEGAVRLDTWGTASLVYDIHN